MGTLDNAPPALRSGDITIPISPMAVAVRFSIDHCIITGGCQKESISFQNSCFLCQDPVTASQGCNCNKRYCIASPGHTVIVPGSNRGREPLDTGESSHEKETKAARTSRIQPGNLAETALLYSLSNFSLQRDNGFAQTAGRALAEGLRGSLLHRHAGIHREPPEH